VRENYSDTPDSACPKAAASEMVQALLFSFCLYFLLYFDWHLHCHPHSDLETVFMVQSHKNKAVSLPLPSDLKANYFQVNLLSRKGEITKKYPLSRPVKIQYFEESAKWMNVDLIKKRKMIPGRNLE